MKIAIRLCPEKIYYSPINQLHPSLPLLADGKFAYAEVTLDYILITSDSY